MNFQTKYEAYNSSWEKFLGLVLLPTMVDKKVKSFTQNSNGFTAKLPTLICLGIPTSYFIHNLYAQYQHNKSLEAQLKVEIGGEVKTINASPNYFDAYTIYNMLATVRSLSNIIDIGVNSKELRTVFVITGVVAGISKLVSLGSDYQEYNFRDENGNSIPPEVVAWGNVLDVEYLNS